MYVKATIINACLAITAAAGFGATAKLWSQYELIGELREQIALMHELVELHERTTQLTEDNCASVHAIEGLCEATLTHLVKQLGIENQLDPLVRTAVWRRLSASAPPIAQIKSFVGMGGGD